VDAALSSTLSTIAMCLAAIRRYGNKQDRTEALLAQALMEELAERHDAIFVKIDDDFLDLELRTFEEIQLAVGEIQAVHHIGNDGEDEVLLEDFQGYLFEIFAQNEVHEPSTPISQVLGK